ncbi:MAG: type II secretion system F family protein [Sedimentisphaerales bacterium]|jgi:tight adherence protein B
MDSDQTLNIIVMAAVFGLVFSIWCICLLLWLGQMLARTKLARTRLGIVREETDRTETVRLWRERKREYGGATSQKKTTLQERLETLKNVIGWPWPAHTILITVGIASLLGFFLAFVTSGNMMLALGVAVLVLIAAWRYVLMRFSKYVALLDMQFVDGLGICARALRAGLPLMGSFQLISEEVDKPIGDIFGRICREQMMGRDLKDSIKKVAETEPSAELKLFATSIAIQLQSGGNLAELMDSLSSVVRARIRLGRRVRVLTSQTQFSKRILIALPFVTFLVLDLINPEYMVSLYTTTAGKYMIIAAAVMILIGAWVMNKLTVLKF